MKGTVKDIIKPILVLTCICLVITSMLAFVNMITSPIIAQAETEAAEKARAEVLPEADSFELINVNDLPASVTEVYKAENGVGYVFMLSAKGYSSTPMSLICGVNSDGTIEACKTLSCSETSNLALKTTESPYRHKYIGKNADTIDEIDAISGATITSTAYKNAIKDALTAFELVKEAE